MSSLVTSTSTTPRVHSKFFAGLRLLSLATCLGGALTVQAATMTLDITGNLPSSFVNNYASYAGGVAGFQWVPEAEAYLNGLTANSPFEVHFTYDPTAPVASQPLTLVGGKISNVADFSDWTTNVSFTQNGSGIETLTISIRKMVFDFPNPALPGRDQYISAHFTASFVDPNFLDGVATLPANPFSLSNLTNLTAEFRYQGGDAGGQEYAFWRSSLLTGFTGALAPENTQPSVPGVPDSGATLLLFGTALLALPAARRLLPA